MAPRLPRWARSAVATFALAIAVSLLPGCDGEAADRAQISAALEGSRPVTFPNDAGDELAGRLFGPDDPAAAGVVLVHGLSADQQIWFPFADRLGREGFRVLTFNLRGVCPRGDGGCSEGDRSNDDAPADVRAAVAALRDDGVGRIGVVGSNLGGTAALLMAAADERRLAAIVTLSAPTLIGGLAVDPDTLAEIDEPKLFIAGTGDATAAAAAQELYARSLQPKRLEILTTDDHGAEIVGGNQAEQSRNAILGWLEAYVAEPNAG